jgi:hypothetical protein
MDSPQPEIHEYDLNSANQRVENLDYVDRNYRLVRLLQGYLMYTSRE